MKGVTFLLAALIASTSAGPPGNQQSVALDEFAAGNRLFSARLYKEVLKENPNQNFVFSPLSAQIILALTQAGARGQTAEEFSTAVNLPANQQTTQNALKQLLPSLKSTYNDVTLSTANKLFLGNDITILKNFKDLATSVFQAAAENVDFSQSQQAADTINQWVEGQTNNKIKNLISPDLLSVATRLVLVNALYFKGKWATPFENYLTKKEPFHISNTETKDIDMMHIEDNFKYYECSKRNAKFLELPYVDDSITMTIVLPNEIEGLAALENNIESLLTPPAYKNERVAVSLPRWLTKSSVDLKAILQKLGLHRAFSDTADFGNISNESLTIGAVLQKSFINVTEYGTEAAAATAVITAESLPPPADYVFVANRPYLYYIRVRNVVSFMGKIVQNDQ